MPTDAAVALGAFLSHRGVTTPLGVFIVIWVCNMAGATAVYFLARRHGRRLFSTGAGRRLLAPRALATIEREYLRFGVAGIFVARFLPGFRAVVAPFAGIANISAARALIPMGLASALWYGAITVLGAMLGNEWSTVSATLVRLNRTLVIAGLVLLAAGVGWWLLRRRRRRREPVWSALSEAFESPPVGMPGHEEVSRRAAAALLLEIAYADDCITAEEREDVARRLRERWGLPGRRAVGPGDSDHPERSSLVSYAARISARFGRERRVALLERMWQTALGDHGSAQSERRIVERAAILLGLTPAEAAAVYERAAVQGDAL